MRRRPIRITTTRATFRDIFSKPLNHAKQNYLQGCYHTLPQLSRGGGIKIVNLVGLNLNIQDRGMIFVETAQKDSQRLKPIIAVPQNSAGYK
jgi:hypothetical protein